jgi:hypothetical protein
MLLKGQCHEIFASPSPKPVIFKVVPFRITYGRPAVHRWQMEKKLKLKGFYILLSHFWLPVYIYRLICYYMC